MLTLTVGTPRDVSAVPRSSQGTELSGRPVVLESSNPNIFTVSGSTLTPIAPGTAQLLATCEGRVFSEDVTVEAIVVPPPPLGIEGVGAALVAKDPVFFVAGMEQDIVADAAMPTGFRMTEWRNVLAPNDGFHWRPSADFDYATYYPGAGGPGCAVTADGILAGPGLELPATLLGRVESAGSDYTDLTKGGHIGLVHRIQNGRTLYLAGEHDNPNKFYARGSQPIDAQIALDGEWLATDYLWVPSPTIGVAYVANHGRMTRSGATGVTVDSVAGARRFRTGIDFATGVPEFYGGGSGTSAPQRIACAWFTKGILTPAERKSVMDFFYDNVDFAALAPITYRPQGTTLVMNGDSYRQAMPRANFFAALPTLDTLMNFSISGTEPSSYIRNWPLMEGGMDLSEVPDGQLVYFGGERQNGGTLQQNRDWMTLVRTMRADIKIVFGLDGMRDNAENDAFSTEVLNNFVTDGYADVIADMFHTAPYDPDQYLTGAPNKLTNWWKTPGPPDNDPAQHPNDAANAMWIEDVIAPAIAALI